jgi:hypothetical protein
LDHTLSLLARAHPRVKFIRTRAGALGFVTSANALNHHNDEDDVDEDEGPNDGGHVVDTEMLPTILVYRNGELVHNWVRVDLVIKEEMKTLDMDIQSLLERWVIIF